jgi:hypothetical protein
MVYRLHSFRKYSKKPVTLEHLQIVYTNACQSAAGRSFQTASNRPEGFCSILRQVFALRNLDDLLGLTQSKRAERRMAEIIKQASKAFARPAVRVEQLTQSCRESDCITLLVQNGWRVRKQLHTKSCVVESN